MHSPLPASPYLSGHFPSLSPGNLLTEADIDAVMRKVRCSQLEADVALPLVRNFIASLKDKAVGAEVVKSINPAQMVI